METPICFNHTLSQNDVCLIQKSNSFHGLKLIKRKKSKVSPRNFSGKSTKSHYHIAFFIVCAPSHGVLEQTIVWNFFFFLFYWYYADNYSSSLKILEITGNWKSFLFFPQIGYTRSPRTILRDWAVLRTRKWEEAPITLKFLFHLKMQDFFFLKWRV